MSKTSAFKKTGGFWYQLFRNPENWYISGPLGVLGGTAGLAALWFGYRGYLGHPEALLTSTGHENIASPESETTESPLISRTSSLKEENRYMKELGGRGINVKSQADPRLHDTHLKPTDRFHGVI